MSSDLLDATVLITSKESNTVGFGSGFVVLRTGETAYVVTCAHIVREVGEDNILVDGEEGKVIATGDSMKLNLAVVKIEIFPGNAVLASRLTNSLEPKKQFQSAGFKRFREDMHKQNLSGYINGMTQVITKPPYLPARSLKFSLSEGDVEEGYIGSPVIDPETKSVLGIISQRTDEGEGIATSIDQLDRIWHPIDKNKLRKVLTDLGFKDHRLEFFKIFRKSRMSAYLIHGPTDKYAQRWMLNRLVQHFLPRSLHTAGKFRVDLSRAGRRNDIPAIWEELAAEMKCDRKATPEEIAKSTASWWLKKDIIIALYDVNSLTEQSLSLLIQDFWLPLVNEIESLQHPECTHKLLMFLVDNEGVTAKRNIPMVSSIGVSENASPNLDSLPLREFSKDDLEDWMSDKYPDLPATLIDGVEALLEASDGGIPEWTFIEICKQFGYHWKAETQEWYVL